jgi:hypothetical protein
MDFDYKIGRKIYMDFTRRPLFVTESDTDVMQPMEAFDASFGYIDYNNVEVLQRRRRIDLRGCPRWDKNKQKYYKPALYTKKTTPNR